MNKLYWITAGFIVFLAIWAVYNYKDNIVTWVLEPNVNEGNQENYTNK